MEQRVKDGAGDDGIAEDLAPRAETLIVGDDDRAAFVGFGEFRRLGLRERFSGSLMQFKSRARANFERFSEKSKIKRIDGGETGFEPRDPLK